MPRLRGWLSIPSDFFPARIGSTQSAHPRGTERRQAQPVLLWGDPRRPPAPSGAPSRGSRLATGRRKAQPQARASWDLAPTGVTRLRPVPAQRAPRSAVVMPHGRGPGAARARGHEPRAQAPRPLPFSRTSQGNAPRGEGDEEYMPRHYGVSRLILSRIRGPVQLATGQFVVLRALGPSVFLRPVRGFLT